MDNKTVLTDPEIEGMSLPTKDGLPDFLKFARAIERAVIAKLPVMPADEPAPEMIQAGAEAAREYYERTGGNDPAVIYKAMRAVAPRIQPAASEANPPKCHKCGMPMIRNPHPDAGKMPRMLEVGCPTECLPCTVLSRHQWSQRALKAEKELREASEAGAVPAYYAAMHGNALYGLFDSEAAAQACIDKGSPSVTWSIKPLYDVPPSAPAAQPEKQAGRKNWAVIQAAVDEYLDDYELRTDEACHTPTEFERFLLTDAVAGLLADDAFMAALAAPPAPSQQAAPAAEPALECERCGMSPEFHTHKHWCDNQSFRATPAAESAEPPASESGLVRDWNAYMDYRAKSSKPAAATADAQGDERAALQTLVDLEDMRLRLRDLHERGHGTDYADYHKALPKAWDAARAALAAAKPEGGQHGE